MQPDGQRHGLPYRTVNMSHPPGAVFQARLLDNQEGANTERDTSSVSSRRDVSYADLVGTGTIPTARAYVRPWKIDSGACDTPSYTCIEAVPKLTEDFGRVFYQTNVCPRYT